jgi:hypothetical protein
MNNQRDPEMGFEPATAKPRSRPHWRRARACLVIGALIGVSGTLTIVLHHGIERAKEAAARAH